MKHNLVARWRTNFFTGLAVVLPAVISIVVVIWLFRNLANLTDTLLFFLPRQLTHENQGEGPIHWFWSVIAFALAMCLICVAGVLARNYFGKKMIEWVDTLLLKVPLLNKIYGATKQVNDALVSGSKGSFKTVGLIEFPRAGMYALGFVTSEEPLEVQAVTTEKVVCVFVPTAPNPTSGFLLILPENRITKLQMSVADGIKYIVSLGAITPAFVSPDKKLKA